MSPDGSKDENVFDIMQGVSINLFVKHGEKCRANTPGPSRLRNNEAALEWDCDAAGTRTLPKLAIVHYADLYGTREMKYDFLQTRKVTDITWKHWTPNAPYYFFVDKDFDARDEYEGGFKIDELLPLTSSGIVTMGDPFAYAENRNVMADRLNDLLDTPYTSSVLNQKYALGKNYADFILRFKKDGCKPEESKYQEVAYRPFELKWTYYDGNVVWRTREKVLRHLLTQGNSSICVVRLNSRGDELPVFCTNKITDKTLLSSKDNCNVFPLYLYDTEVEPPSRRVNFDAAIYKKICKAAGLKFSDEDLQATACKHGAKSSACKSCPEDSNPQRVFDYIYGVLHSSKYRKKYAEFLKIDFPRIPYPKSGEEFRTMATFGAELRRIHCMEDFDEAAEVELVEGHDGEDAVATQVVKPVWKDGCVYIDKDVKFTNVSEDLWNFYIGGYQPLQKWLKDRKGRELSAEDVSHYKRMVRAIARTRDIMAKIDAAYEV